MRGGGGGGVEQFGCSHAYFGFSVNVTINYKIVAVIITVIIADK